MMEPRLSLITLGVADLDRAVAFYEALGFPRKVRAARAAAFFRLGPLALSLYPTRARTSPAMPASPSWAGRCRASRSPTTPRPARRSTR